MMAGQPQIPIGSQEKPAKQVFGEDKVKTTIDSFHNGDFELVQPGESGHRAGLDALLLAASLPKDASGMLADLGSGSGAVGLAALNLNPGLELVSVELNDTMFDLLQRTKDLPNNSRFRSRMNVLQADVTKTGAERLKQGLADNSFDHVIMNPPYNTENHRHSGDPIKFEAHVLGDGGLDAWFRTAAAILRPGGTFSMIYRSENISAVLACSQGRFGGLEILPIHSRVNEAAKRILVRSVRGSRAPLAILPGLVVHEEDGSFTPAADAIFKGETSSVFEIT